MITGDLGVGDNDTDYNINAVAAYKINKLYNVWAGYRHLEIDNETETDGPKFEIAFVQQGPS